MTDQLACLLSPNRWVICCCWLAVGGSLLLQRPSPSDASELRKTPIVKAVGRARPSVVNIRGEKTVGGSGSELGRADAGRRVNGMGTGVVIDPRGYIVTNYHVVDGVRQIQITLCDGDQYTADLIARDPETDLAIIKIPATERLPVITLGTSADLMPGEPVVAVGNAYGYEHTVTRGIISALHRAVQVSDAQFYEDLIQTDASINPGNSGGPLLNIDGEMIGINVAVRAGAQGIGFAIPVDKMLSVATRLLAARNIKNAWHGVVLAKDARDDGPGSIVTSVDKESPAAKAGLQAGDVITTVGQMEIDGPLSFHRAMMERSSGERVKLSVRRDDERLEVDLALADAPDQPKPSPSPSWQALGLELKPIPPDEFRKRFRTRYRGGLTVTAVRPNSPAADEGVRQGDVLVGMHIWETIKLENVAYILNRPDFAGLTPVKFFILRGKDTLYGYLSVSMNRVRQQ